MHTHNTPDTLLPPPDSTFFIWSWLMCFSWASLHLSHRYQRIISFFVVLSFFLFFLGVCFIDYKNKFHLSDNEPPLCLWSGLTFLFFHHTILDKKKCSCGVGVLISTPKQPITNIITITNKSVVCYLLFQVLINTSSYLLFLSSLSCLSLKSSLSCFYLIPFYSISQPHLDQLVSSLLKHCVFQFINLIGSLNPFPPVDPVWNLTQPTTTTSTNPSPQHHFVFSPPQPPDHKCLINIKCLVFICLNGRKFTPSRIQSGLPPSATGTGMASRWPCSILSRMIERKLVCICRNLRKQMPSNGSHETMLNHQDKNGKSQQNHQEYSTIAQHNPLYHLTRKKSIFYGGRWCECEIVHKYKPTTFLELMDLKESKIILAKLSDQPKTPPQNPNSMSIPMALK
ncbi:hypothetical protein VP01_2297g1 [Puccinia sorghi]|uniref:Uncharacterized protein n=1 Tax=Puccinia sorghi TaxID=27349 RepID=A0A0L6V8P2_9BASI|nr:hypothetical protein VP01_2297g1 [Puccinia sorghi]